MLSQEPSGNLCKHKETKAFSQREKCVNSFMLQVPVSKTHTEAGKLVLFLVPWQCAMLYFHIWLHDFGGSETVG